jgi:hypothetical protein
MVRISWKGVVIASQMERSALNGLEALGNEIKSLSQTRCPVDSGTLRGSAQVVRENDKVIIGYGGAASSYSIAQHENLGYHHPVGQAKFLESAFDELSGKVEEYVKRAIKL